MNILDTIAAEIQEQTGHTPTKEKDLPEDGGNTHYAIQTQNHKILIGLCDQTTTTDKHYNGTHILIIKSSKTKKRDVSFLTQPHKFIDLNDPQSIPEIIKTIKEYT